MRSFIPIAVFYAMSLVLSNQAYRFLSVSYIQMLKAFTPVYVLGIGVIGGLEKPSCLQLSVVLMICSGVSLSSFGELEFVLIGFIFQMCGGLSESIRLVLQVPVPSHSLVHLLTYSFVHSLRIKCCEISS
jgi:drug/metabolite transporter (DMT)-like permease